MKAKQLISVLLVAVATLTGYSSCSKDYDGDISDLNTKYSTLDQRVTKIEDQVNTMNQQLTQLSVLATAVENGFYVTQVKTTLDGYELTLSNGKTIILQNGPDNTVAPAPYISMTLINNIHYWTVNGMLIIDSDGRPIPATGQTPVLRYNTTVNRWTISVDGGITFKDLNVFASITINNDVLLQVINNFISQHNTTIFSQEMLYQIISTYIQQNYSKVFNIEIMNKVISNYLDQHYTTIFNYDLLVQLFNQYNFEYSAKNIDVDIITNILINFIKENKQVFVNNEVLFEIISNYIEINKLEIFDIDIIAEVINNYIEKNTNFINIELMRQIINNYIDQHQEIIFDNDIFITILQQYVQENYLIIFNQDILYQVVNNYISKNKTTIFNETIIREIINNYVQNNYTNIIDVDILYKIVNNYISVNKTTIINEKILYEVISNYLSVNFNLFVDETYIKTIINNYITEHQTTIIDIDIVRQIVNTYIHDNIYTIFDVDILNQLIVNYFEQNTTVIQEYVNQYTGIIKSVIVDGDYCFVTLNDGKTIQLFVYDTYATIRDRVQSIVVVPNKNGHVYCSNNSSTTLTYLVTPAAMAPVISNQMEVTLKGLDAEGKVVTCKVSSVKGDKNGTLTVSFNVAEDASIFEAAKSIALCVKDSKASGGTDYVTTFTPIDWVSLTHMY